MNDEALIREIYCEYWNGMIEKDTDALRELMPEDYSLMHMTGVRQSRETFLKGLQGGTFNYYSAEHDSINEFIRITRSTVVTSRNKPEGHSIPCNMINCFCMFSDYIPVTLDDWIRIDAGRRAKLNRQSN